jgi:hypothetical protein
VFPYAIAIQKDYIKASVVGHAAPMIAIRNAERLYKSLSDWLFCAMQKDNIKASVVVPASSMMLNAERLHKSLSDCAERLHKSLSDCASKLNETSPLE